MSLQTQNQQMKGLSRRQMLQLMGAAAGMSALSACVAAQPAAAPAAGGEAPAAAPGQLVVVHRREYFAEMETLFEDAVKKWGTENNVEIDVTPVASEAFEDFVAKLVAQVQAGNPPDLVYHVRLVQQLYSLGALEPVTDLVEESKSLYGDPAFSQVSLNQIDGEWYGVPYIMNGGGAFARRDVFEAAGINPDDLKTFEQRRDAALQVSDPSKEMYGWGVTVNRGGDGQGFILSIIQNWGGHYTDADRTMLTFDSPETLAAVEWLAEIYTSDKYASMLPPGILSWTDSSNNEAYLAGNIAYTHNAASVYAKAKADGNPLFEQTVYLETGVGPLGTKLESGGGGQFNVPKGAKNPADAKKLAGYLLTPDVFMPISLISAGLFLPAYTKFYELDSVKKAFEADVNLQRMGQAAQGDFLGASYPAQPHALFDQIDAAVILPDMMAQIITNGVSPADAIKTAAERMQQIADETEAFKQ